MTKDKQRKARVRARMARTGESYASANAHVAKTAEASPLSPTGGPRIAVDGEDDAQEVELDLGDGRVMRGHPYAIEKFKESRDRERARAARWPQRPDGSIDTRRAMTVLARSFPTLAHARGVEPFDANAFVLWLCTSGEAGGGAVRAGRFVLQVWNASTDWREVGRELGVDREAADDVLRSFNVVQGISGWDEEHRKAFLTWCEAPFWP